MRFISCGVLNFIDGGGLKIPSILKIKDGIYYGDFIIDEKFIKYNKLDIPFKIKEMTGDFYCIDTSLSSLENSPEKIRGGFYCFSNKLTNLLYSPKYIGKNFNCSSNNITSLEGCPKYVGGDFKIYDNPGKFTEQEVRAVCDVKGSVFV